MTDNKIGCYAFMAQTLKLFQLGLFQASGIANKLTDPVSPVIVVYPRP